VVQLNREYSSVGIASLDGQGNIAAIESRYSAGPYLQVASSGTIIINSDCTAAISLTGTGASASSMNFLAIVSLDEKQLLFVQSDAGTATSGSLIAQ
jgi:hypothetical protein